MAVICQCDAGDLARTAQTVIAAAIPRQLHAVITTGQPWDPHIATRGPATASGSPLPPDPSLRHSSWRPGRALRGIEESRVTSTVMGSPPSSHQSDYTLTGPNPITAIQARTTDEAPAESLTQTALR